MLPHMRGGDITDMDGTEASDHRWLFVHLWLWRHLNGHYGGKSVRCFYSLILNFDVGMIWCVRACLCVGRWFYQHGRYRRKIHLRQHLRGRELPVQAHQAGPAFYGQQGPRYQRLPILHHDRELAWFLIIAHQLSIWNACLTRLEHWDWVWPLLSLPFSRADTARWKRGSVRRMHGLIVKTDCSCDDPMLKAPQFVAHEAIYSVRINRFHS